MSFINKFKDTANVLANKTKEAGNSIGSATKSAVEKQKLKSAISKEELNIEKQYKEIGKKYVELFSDKETVDPEFVDYLNAIETSKQEIEKLQAQIYALEDCVTCACGAKVPKNAKYCQVCGNAIQVPTVETTTEIVQAEEVTVEEATTEAETETEPQPQQPTEETTTQE